MSPATLTQPSHDVSLTGEEIRVLAVLGSGATSDATARRLDISPRTVRRRVRRVCERVGVDTTVQAVAWAARRGYI